MITHLSIDDIFDLHKNVPIFDVRTSAEYEHAHIPNAINLPLFSNEDRIKIGTTYKQIGREEAILLGFELVGNKWADFIRFVKAQTDSKKIIVHCWRGGMRSASMAWALSFYGFDVFVIIGGYKAYRNYVLEYFNKPIKINLLGGLTGSGKTIILHQLKEKGEQIIDLEDLAQHQGSAFGSMDKLIQPSQEQFENNLNEILMKTDPEKICWIEDESITIGKRVIPLPFWQQMRNAKLIEIELDIEERINLLLTSYGQLPKDFLIESTLKIAKRLGPKLTQETIEAIENKEMALFIRNVLYYYDKTYQMGLSKKIVKQLIKIEFKKFELENMTNQILNLDLQNIEYGRN